jgi:putative sterol carrier protein
VDQRSALLYTWKVKTDPRYSEHFPISIECDGIIEPRCGRIKDCRLHNKDTDWTAFMENVKEKITEVKTHNGWNRDVGINERYENFIHIIKGKLEETT